MSSSDNTLLGELIFNTPPSDENEYISFLGRLVNLSLKQNNEKGLLRTIALCEDEKRVISKPKYASYIFYCCANAFSGLRKIRYADWAWNIPEAEKEIFYLRKALLSAKRNSNENKLQCSILTNLANAFDFIGRFVEAIELYDQALALDDGFSIARANRGVARHIYGISLYDPGLRHVFYKRAYGDLINSIDGDLEVGARDFFQNHIDSIKKVYRSAFLNSEDSFRHRSLGNSQKEKAYRKWCLREKLFLNPLNDLVSESAAADDIISTPPIAIPIGDGMYFQGMFNQLKQEYATARYLYYESRIVRGKHFSDARVKMINTLDYPAYGISTEKLKLSFRTSISLFDKIAYYINRYFEFRIPEKNIYFKKMWYKDNEKKQLSRKTGSGHALCILGIR